MTKSQTILVSVGVVFILALLGAAYITIQSVSKASESAEKLEKVKKDYARIFKTANPFPSEENKEILEKNLEQAREWEKKLLTIIREGEYNPESKQTNPGYFSNKRQEMIERLTTTAPKGPDGKSVAVEGLTFGFDKYKDGAPASKNDVPRLMEQLTLIDGLVQLLYDAEIDKLKAVRREEFEDVDNQKSDEEASSSSRRSSRRSSRNRASNVTTNSGGPVPIEPFEQGAVEVDRQRFEFVFDARQNSLMTILNEIGTMKPYAIVSKLSFVKASDDYRPPVDEQKDEKKSKRRSQAEEASENQIVLNVRPPSRTSRLVSGELHEAPVTVSMTVDVFTFKPEEENTDAMEAEEYADDSMEESVDSQDADANVANEEANGDF